MPVQLWPELRFREPGQMCAAGAAWRKIYSRASGRTENGLHTIHSFPETAAVDLRNFLMKNLAVFLRHGPF
jgi:hypothetical protein